MNQYVENKMKSQVRHIFNMQTLLNQYDRQNKHLNKQIIALLEENTKLKIDKLRSSQLRQNFINKQNALLKKTVLDSPKKQRYREQSVSKQVQTSPKKINEKAQKYVQNEQNIKKTQNILIQKSKNQIITNVKQENINGSDNKQIKPYYSFGKQKFPEISNDVLDQTRHQTLKKQQNILINHNSSSQKKFLQKIKSNQKQQISSNYIRSKIDYNNNNILNFKLIQPQVNNGNNNKDDQTIIEKLNTQTFQKKQLERGKSKQRLRQSSCHAIKPIAPIINNTNAMNKLHELGGFRRSNSQFNIKRQSVEKKKKFIALVSCKDKKDIIEKQNDSCC